MIHFKCIPSLNRQIGLRVQNDQQFTTRDDDNDMRKRGELRHYLQRGRLVVPKAQVSHVPPERHLHSRRRCSPSDKAYSGSRSEEIGIPWKPRRWSSGPRVLIRHENRTDDWRRWNWSVIYVMGGKITEVLYRENGADKHDKIWRSYILYEYGADKHDKITTVLYTLRKRCRWTWPDHWGVIYFMRRCR